MTALSINDPGPELFGTDGPAVARMVNDWIGEITQQASAAILRADDAAAAEHGCSRLRKLSDA